MQLNKKLLSERDICTKYITPALEQAGWDKHIQLPEEVSFTDGKIYVRGKFADLLNLSPFKMLVALFVQGVEIFKLLKVRPLTQFGSPVEVVQAFGGEDGFLKAVRELEGKIFRIA